MGDQEKRGKPGQCRRTTDATFDSKGQTGEQTPGPLKPPTLDLLVCCGAPLPPIGDLCPIRGCNQRRVRLSPACRYFCPSGCSESLFFQGVGKLFCVVLDLCKKVEAFAHRLYTCSFLQFYPYRDSDKKAKAQGFRGESPRNQKTAFIVGFGRSSSKRSENAWVVFWLVFWGLLCLRLGCSTHRFVKKRPPHSWWLLPSFASSEPASLCPFGPPGLLAPGIFLWSIRAQQRRERTTAAGQRPEKTTPSQPQPTTDLKPTTTELNHTAKNTNKSPGARVTRPQPMAAAASTARASRSRPMPLPRCSRCTAANSTAPSSDTATAPTTGTAKCRLWGASLAAISSWSFRGPPGATKFSCCTMVN